MSARAITFVGWNVENLAPHLALPAAASGRASRTRATRAAAPLPLAEIAARLGDPDVLCLQEARLRDGDTAAIAALPDHECQLSLCSDRKNVGFRGGRAYGVVSYVRRALQPRWLARARWDLEGRLALCELPAQNLVIGNVYAVNGTGKPYFDHELGALHGDRHAFKRRFQERLMHALAELCAAGRELVLLGDWNVSRSALDTFPRLRTEPPHALARKLFNESFLPALDLADVFRELHPDAREYTWFNRRAPRETLDAARVDFVLVSRSLLSRVRSASIEPERALRFRSDHAPVRLVLEPPSARSAQRD